MSVTPDFVGQRYKDTNTGNIWIANSTTPGDWSLELQNMEMKWTPTSSRLAELIGFAGYYSSAQPFLGLQEIDFDFSTTNQVIDLTGDYGSNASVTALRFNNLVSITDDGYLTVSSFSILTQLYVPLLVTCGRIMVTDCDSLTALTFDSLVTTTDSITCSQHLLLQSISFPELTVAQAISVHTNPALQVVSIPALVPTNGKAFDCQGASLTSASVNHILSRYVANPSYVSGSIKLQGGTNAAPSGQGIVDKATLIARGVTVTTN